MKKINLLLGLYLILSVLPIASGTSTTIPMSEVWEVGDWVSYEAVSGIFVIQSEYTVIEAKYDELGTPDYIWFMMNSMNNSVPVMINATTGQMFGYSYNYTEDEDTLWDQYVYSLLIRNPNFHFLPRVNLSMLFDDLEILEIEPNFYESNALVHVDGNPTIIPVTGVTYEYSNISDTEPYNYTTYNFTDWSSETTLVQVHTNYSIKFEIHEPTGVMVNMLSTLYLNTTMSLFNVPYSTGSYTHLVDSHGVFDPSEEPVVETVTETMTVTESVTIETSETTTSKEKASGFLFVSVVIVGTIVVLIRKRRNKKGDE